MNKNGVIMKPAFVKKYEKLGKPIPMPDPLKHTAIQHYAKKNKARYLVETGTYLGGTVIALQDYFDKLITIEVSPAVAAKFREACPNLPDHITALVGKSYALLPAILPGLKGPRIFWLDAHGSTWGNEFGGESVDVPESSVVQELDIIFANKNKGDIVLIDDINIFGTFGWIPIEKVIDTITEAGYSYRAEGLILVVELTE